MNKKSFYKNSMIFAIFILLMGASFLPVISGSINDLNNSSNEKSLSLNNDLVAYWSFDEGSGGTVYDDSGNGHDGTINGASWTTGICDDALRFDGGNDYISFSSSVLSTPPYSVCTWVKPDTVDPSKNRYIIANGGHNQEVSGFYMALAENYTHHLFYQYQFGGTKINGDHGVSYKQATSTGWTFLCGTWDGSLIENNFRFYINGIRVSNVDIFPVTGGSSYNLRIGKPIAQSNYYWDGLIDEVRIYDKVLSSSEISTLYNTPCGNNQAPNIPDIPIGPTGLDIDEVGTFSTSATDPDNDWVQYRFDWNASGNHDYTSWTDLDISGHMDSRTHSWSSPGLYDVKSQARDKHGMTSSWSSSLTVSVPPYNNPPNIPDTPSGPSLLEVDESGTFTTSGTDPDDDMVQYRFDWNDGTISSWTSLGASGHSDSKSHSWSSSGTYYVRAQTRDEYNTVSGWSDSLSVTVTGGGNNPPYTPSKPSGPANGNVDESYSYSASTTDPDGDSVRYYFDWDDGTGDWTSYGSSGSTKSLSHSWSSIGSYNVRVRASDSHGSQSSFSPSLTVTITSDDENQPPGKPFITGPTSGKTGNSYTYTAYTTDPEGDDVFYWFYWDDGEEDGWEGSYASGETCEKSHIWTAEGTYSIKVKAKDEFSLESEWSDSLSIEMPKNKLISLFHYYFEQQPILKIILERFLYA